MYLDLTKELPNGCGLILGDNHLHILKVTEEDSPQLLQFDVVLVKINTFAVNGNMIVIDAVTSNGKNYTRTYINCSLSFDFLIN